MVGMPVGARSQNTSASRKGGKLDFGAAVDWALLLDYALKIEDVRDCCTWATYTTQKKSVSVALTWVASESEVPHSAFLVAAHTRVQQYYPDPNTTLEWQKKDPAIRALCENQSESSPSKQLLRLLGTLGILKVVATRALLPTQQTNVDRARVIAMIRGDIPEVTALHPSVVGIDGENLKVLAR